MKKRLKKAFSIFIAALMLSESISAEIIAEEVLKTEAATEQTAGKETMPSAGKEVHMPQNETQTALPESRAPKGETLAVQPESHAPEGESLTAQPESQAPEGGSLTAQPESQAPGGEIRAAQPESQAPGGEIRAAQPETQAIEREDRVSQDETMAAGREKETEHGEFQSEKKSGGQREEKQKEIKAAEASAEMPKMDAALINITWPAETVYTWSGGNLYDTVLSGVHAVANNGSIHNVTLKVIHNGTDTGKNVTDAGRYDVTAMAAPADHFSGATATFTFYVKKKVSVIWPEATEYRYTGNDILPDLRYRTTDGQGVVMELTAGSAADGKAVEPGAYTIKVKALASDVDNDKYILGENEDFTFTIKEQPGITVTGYEGAYDGDLHCISASSETDGVAFRYSTDGENWSDINPTFTDVTDTIVYVKAEKEGIVVWEGQGTVKITQAPITITAHGNTDDTKVTKVYGEEDPDYKADKKYTVTGLVGTDSEELITFSFEREGKDGAAADQYDPVGEYTVNVKADEIQGNYKVLTQSGKLTVTKRPMWIKAGDLTAVFTNAEVKADDYFKAGQGELRYKTQDPADGEGLLSSDSIYDNDLKFEGFGSNVQNVPYPISIQENTIVIKHGEDDVTGCYNIRTETGSLTIEQLPVTVIPDTDQWKYYNEKDPVFTYEAVIDENRFSEKWCNLHDAAYEIPDRLKLHELLGECLERKDTDENADAYVGEIHSIGLKDEFENKANINIADVKETLFEIRPLPVKITPDGKEKLVGENDPDDFAAYMVDFNITEPSASDGFRDDFDQDAAHTELGEHVIDRIPGELPGTYDYKDVNENRNYAVSLDETIKFKINKLRIKDVPNTITSRETSFSFGTDLDADNLLNDQDRLEYAVNVSVNEWPQSVDGITFDQKLTAYISGQVSGDDDSVSAVFSGDDDSMRVPFSGAGGSVSVTKSAEYSIVKGNNTYTWDGGLPAGTQLTVSIVAREKSSGSWSDWTQISSNIMPLDVVKEQVRLSWGCTGAALPDIHYLRKNDKLILTGTKSEFVQVDYGGTTYFETAGEGIIIAPLVNNNGTTHIKQTVNAAFLDRLNLAFSPVNFSFTYDNEAFPISSIRYENRGDHIEIILPEIGIIKSITIAGATKVEIPEGEGTIFKAKVTFSGRNLIPTGAAITVEYEDQAGNTIKGSSAAARSTVSTPATVNIRPVFKVVNQESWVNGASGKTLMVYGTACACEPLRVTVADMSVSTHATQYDVWSDTQGNWQAAFDMGHLPEDREFLVTVEYMDVNGPGAQMTVRYNPYVALPAQLSAVYEGMSYFSGMIEKGAAAVMKIGESYYELAIDQFGRFEIDNVPMMFAGEDSFSIIVTDIFGNKETKVFEITDIRDENGTLLASGNLSPPGKFIYGGDNTASAVYSVLPVRVSDLVNGDLTLPLLIGSTQKVGEFTASKANGGITLTSSLDLEEGAMLDPKNFTVKDAFIYVYMQEPSFDALERKVGEVF